MNAFDFQILQTPITDKSPAVTLWRPRPHLEFEIFKKKNIYIHINIDKTY